MAKKKQMPTLKNPSNQTGSESLLNGSAVTEGPVDEVKQPARADSPAKLRSDLSTARQQRDSQSETSILEKLKGENGSIVIELPIAELETDGYGVSTKNAPRMLNRQRISHEAGIGLARLQLAMINRGEKLNSGGLVTSKERVVARLLELVEASAKEA